MEPQVVYAKAHKNVGVAIYPPEPPVPVDYESDIGKSLQKEQADKWGWLAEDEVDDEQSESESQYIPNMGVLR